MIQRAEPIDFAQDAQRETEIFQAYGRQSIQAIKAAKRNVDAVVWPESMYTGGLPWMMAAPDASVPAVYNLTASEFQARVADNREFFLQRSNDVQNLLAASQPESSARPHILAGCGVIKFGQQREVFSGVVHLQPDGTLPDWYGKMHRVMIGEYIPIVSLIPGSDSWLPSVTPGPGPRRFMVGETAVSPNICIETAIERVTINQLAELQRQDQLPDVVVSVTNDGWFDDSHVIAHHLRCAQLVAVGCRRPLLSAANNGPTAWIDSSGQLVERLPRGTNGAIIAEPRADDRVSLYLSIGDWPARVTGLLFVLALLDGILSWRRRRRPPETEGLAASVESPRS